MAIGNHLTTKEVAEELEVSPGRVRQFAVEERLKNVLKVGTQLFFDRNEVARFKKKDRKIGRPNNSEK